MLSKNSTLCSRSRFVILLFLVLSFTPFATLISQTFYPNPDSIPFAPAVNYEAGDGSTPIFCADLDGDSDLDIAVANTHSNNLSILENNGDGTLQAKVDYSVGDFPVSIFCADLDGDGDLDLAVANRNSNNVSILKNNGDGTFQTKVDYPAGSGSHSVYCADLDGDGDLDLAVADVWVDNVSILKNNGDGTFQTGVAYATADYPLGVSCADLDGDGDLDLAVANNGMLGGNSVSILKNNGDGTFQTKVDYAAADYPRDLFCADLDGDGDIDIATANWGGMTVSILKNNGDGTFETHVEYGVRLHPHFIFCADLDGDGYLDVVTGNRGEDYSPDSTVSILRNNGNGTFQTKVDYRAGYGASGVFCADLDGDGDLDLSVGNQFSDNVSVLKNLTPPNPLVGYWKFDEGTGVTAYDSSGNNNHGTIYGTTWTDGKLGRGLNFTKLSDYVEVNDSPILDLTDHLTITAWIRPHAFPGHTPKIVGKGYVSTYSYWLGFAGVSVILTLENSAGYCEAYHSFVLDEWAYVAATWDGTTTHIYINGKDEGSTVKNYTGTLTPNEHPLIIGSRDNGYNDYFNGTIDEVKIYNRALSGDEIREEYERVTLAAYWKFDEGTGNIAHDSSAFGNNGTLMNDPTWVVGLPLLGKALEFDGVDDYVMIPDSPSLDINGPGITFMTWIYSPGFQDFGWIMGKGDSDWGKMVWWLLPESDGAIRYGIKSGSTTHEQLDIPVGLTTNIWQHVAVVYDGSYMRFYLNAVEKDSFPKTGNMDVNDVPVLIGLDGWNTNNHYRGKIDEVKVFGRALSTEEIKAEFEAGFARGDANADGKRTVSDVVYLINYLFKGGTFPQPLQAGDCNCDGKLTVSDVVYLINYLFKGGPSPVC
ncbi:MAG: FG-GAP-like repeat-containing protein [candidate division Zixibacteria bacterium]|nr:FG-GAP-like repeat-containing protein [candidate division Zixibacteria bacterium]